MSEGLAQNIRFSLRSRRKHKAWGVSPRIRELEKQIEPAKRVTVYVLPAVARFAGFVTFYCLPGAYATGFMLMPASRAKASPWSAAACRRFA
jgi:hypothetical protein